MNTQTSVREAERNREAVREFLEGTHGGRWIVVDERVDPTIVTHGFPGANPASREDYRAFFAALDSAFPDMAFSLETIVAEPRFVAVRFSITGTHQGEYLGIPATDRRVEFTGMALYRMTGGRIAETWLHPDNLTILQQLGVQTG